jgi:hypothetical protein
LWQMVRDAADGCAPLPAVALDAWQTTHTATDCSAMSS